jgi:hypothetical protein
MTYKQSMVEQSPRGAMVQDEPILVQGNDCNVAITAPDGSVVILSPDAAEVTSDRLWKWAMAGRLQQRRRDATEHLDEERLRPFNRWDENAE